MRSDRIKQMFQHLITPQWEIEARRKLKEEIRKHMESYKLPVESGSFLTAEQFERFNKMDR